MKKYIPLYLSLLILMAIMTVSAFASDFTDMPNDWSTPALESAIENGLLNGDNDKILPKNNLTRAEMATILNRAFGSTQKADLSDYTDVPEHAWYYADMAKAVQMKTFMGSDNKLNPDNNITREEVFVVLARAFKLSSGSEEALDQFSDKELVSDWATNGVASLVAEGYVAGSDGKLKPKQNITRAEFAQIMDNLLKNYIQTDGTYIEDMNGNVMINRPDVILKDMTITGDLIIGDGVGDGDITLDNITITGRTVIRGGGVNSIKIIGNSNIKNIMIARVDGQVRVYAEDGTQIGDVAVDGNDNVIIEGDVGNVTVTAPDIIVTANNAEIESATIEGENSIITVSTNSTMKTATVDAENAEIRVLKGSKIEDIVINSDGAKITGKGNVGTVAANADNIVVSTPGTSVTADSETTGVTAGTKTVDPGSTATTTSSTRRKSHSSADTTAPTGYSVSIDQSYINNSNMSALSFTFASAEVGATYNYSVDDTNDDTTAVTGTGTISTEIDQIGGINVSGLDDDTLTLTVNLTDTAENLGANTTDTVTKDADSPSGYSINIDQSLITSANQTTLSFTFASAEVGATYNYSVDDTNGDTTTVTGTGTISTAIDQISGIDVSELDDDTLTLSVYLTDVAGNQGANTTDTVIKDSTSLCITANANGDAYINSLEATVTASISVIPISGTIHTVSISGINKSNESPLTETAIFNDQTSEYEFDATLFKDGALTVIATDLQAVESQTTLILDTKTAKLITGGNLIELTGSDNPLAVVQVNTWAFPSAGDLNGDGRLDVVVGDMAGYIQTYYQQPDGTYLIADPNPLASISTGMYTFPGLGDFDGDNDLDLVVGLMTGYVQYYKNTGTEVNPVFTIQEDVNNPFADVYNPRYAFNAAGDVDADGDVDVLFAYGDNGTANAQCLELWINDGSGHFAKDTDSYPTFSSYSMDNGDEFVVPYLGDFNGDGKIDFGVYAEDRSITIYFYEGDGLGTYTLNETQNPFSEISVNRPFASAGDIDGDGDSDFLIGYSGGVIRSFQNNVGEAVNLSSSQIIDGLGSGNVTTDATELLLLSGKGAEDQANISLYIDGNLLTDEIQANDSGEWVFTWIGTEDGFDIVSGESYSITVKQTDVAGNTSEISEAYNITISISE